MLCLIGYAGNSSAILIEHLSSAAEAGAEALGEALHERAEHAAEAEGEAVVGAMINGTYFFTEHYFSAIRSAVAFYLVAKLMRLGLFIVYGILLPKFRRALFLAALSLVVISCIWLPLLFVKSPTAIITLVVAGIGVELASRYVLAAAMQILHGRSKHKNGGVTSSLFIPAISIEHLMERMVCEYNLFLH